MPSGMPSAVVQPCSNIILHTQATNRNAWQSPHQKPHLIKGAQILGDPQLVIAMLGNHRPKSADTGPPTYECQEPAPYTPRPEATATPLHIIIKQPVTERPNQSNKHQARPEKGFILRQSPRRVVAGADDVDSEGEVPAVAGDPEGLEQQERRPERARVERVVRHLAPRLHPRLLHHLQPGPRGAEAGPSNQSSSWRARGRKP